MASRMLGWEGSRAVCVGGRGAIRRRMQDPRLQFRLALGIYLLLLFSLICFEGFGFSDGFVFLCWGYGGFRK